MIEINSLAPIALFTYNRPIHTQKVLDSLALNPESKLSNLFVFCDGPKDEYDADEVLKINQVKEIVKNENRFNKTTVFIQNKNKGLASSIIDGVTELVNKYEVIIVLEDDIIVSRGFLKYMNDALRTYEKSNKVMHVSGWVFPFHDDSYKLDTFFHKPCSCWGWATWKRAWSFFEKNPEEQIKLMDEKQAWNEFTLNNTFPSFKDQVYQNLNGSINTWAIFWYLSVFLNKGTSLHPTKSLVQNIGFDGTGIHNGEWEENNPFLWKDLAEYLPVKRKFLFKSEKENALLREAYSKKLFSYEVDTNKMNKLKNKFKQFIRKIFSSYNFNFIKNKKKIKEASSERYKKGEILFYGNKFKYLDKASFDFIFDELFIKNIYKFKTLSESPVIIDCGANIGLSVVYFKRNFPSAKILAFEADPTVYEVLVENISKFDYKDVTLLNYALWDDECEISFNSEGSDGGRIDTTLITGQNLVRCKTARLSSYLNQKIDMLKIDIEGAEVKVLNECKDLLVNVDNLFVEFHSFSNEKQELSVLLKILEENNFRYYISQTGSEMFTPFIQIIDYLGIDNSLNIFAYRR